MLLSLLLGNVYDDDDDVDDDDDDDDDDYWWKISQLTVCHWVGNWPAQSSISLISRVEQGFTHGYRVGIKLICKSRQFKRTP